MGVEIKPVYKYTHRDEMNIDIFMSAVVNQKEVIKY